MAAEGEIGGFPYPRDLLRRFSGDEAAAEASPELAGEVELSLGLSLGGGGGGGGEKGLARSSSISMFPATERAAAETQWLARAHSLPVESEEEWRRRKEMQSLKRMEAKRKRSEKRARERKGEAEEEVVVVGPTVKVKEEEEEVVVVCGKAKGVAEVGGAYRWGGPGKPGSQGSIGSQGSSSSGVSDFESKPLHGNDT